MPPKKTSSGAGAAVSSAGRTTKRAAGLAQPMLPFRSRKPTGSPLKGAKAGGTAARPPTTLGRTLSGASNASTTIDMSTEDDDEEDVEDVEEEQDDVERVLREKQQARATAAVKTSGKAAKQGSGKADGKEHLDVKDKRWTGVYKDAVVQMGGQKPIHAGPETHNNVHHILRVFDMTSKYGPYVGVTRLQRWERAKKWGLNPPEEIKMILTTVEGENEPEYRENVLHSWLG